MSDQVKQIMLVTDGACLGNPGPGGWAALLRFNDHEKMFSGAEPDTTNNRMEMMAVICGLQQVSQSCHVTIVTDSQYVQKGITEWLPKWRRNGFKTAANKPVKNQDLWHELADEVERHTVVWQWVKGHSGHEDNERVDDACREAAIELANRSK